MMLCVIFKSTKRIVVWETINFISLTFPLLNYETCSTAISYLVRNYLFSLSVVGFLITSKCFSALFSYVRLIALCVLFYFSRFFKYFHDCQFVSFTWHLNAWFHKILKVKLMTVRCLIWLIAFHCLRLLSLVLMSGLDSIAFCLAASVCP